MAIAPYRPATEMFRSFFDDALSSTWGGRLGGTDLMGMPHADVVENRDEIRVTLELPGMRPDDIEVSLENNLLTISGEKKEARHEEDESSRWHLSERRYGRFSRSFVLPRDVEQDSIQATFEDGVLTLVMPKSEKVKPRRIEVRGTDGGQRIEPITST